MPSGREVVLPAAGSVSESRAYFAGPEKPTRGIVIIHEILGPQPEIDRVAERFAAHGYAAVVPTLFDSLLRPACIRNAMLTMRTGQGPFVDQLRRTRAWLCEQTGLPESSVGLIGFCMGGGFALAAGSGWAAVSTNYGAVPSAEVMQGIGPVIGCYGGRDVLFRNKGKVLKQRLEPMGIEVETHTFPSAGHTFLTDGHHPLAEAISQPLMHIRYEPAVAEEAWRRIMSFFDRHLPAS